MLTTARMPIEEVELPSGKVKPGTFVSCALGAADRDPNVFSDPGTFDTERGQQGNLGFGRGIHHHPGLHIARTQAEVVLRQLMRLGPERMGEVRQRDTLGTRAMRGLDASPVRFTTR